MNNYKYPTLLRVFGNSLSIPLFSLSLCATIFLTYKIITSDHFDLRQILFISFPFIIFLYSYWQITAYPNIALSEEGIYYKRLFRWRFIPWNKIKTITHYDTKGWRTPMPSNGIITSITTEFYARNLHITDAMIDYTDAMNYILEHAKDARVTEH